MDGCRRSNGNGYVMSESNALENGEGHTGGIAFVVEIEEAGTQVRIIMWRALA